MNRTGISQRLELRQSQTLVMTPQLQQAIKMLQLSNLELSDFVDGEIQQNPLLERQDQGSSEPTPHADAAGDAPAPVSSPEVLTGDFTSEAIEHWQPEWGDEGDRAIDLGGEPQPWWGLNGEPGRIDRPGSAGEVPIRGYFRSGARLPAKRRESVARRLAARPPSASVKDW